MTTLAVQTAFVIALVSTFSFKKVGSSLLKQYQSRVRFPSSFLVASGKAPSSGKAKVPGWESRIFLLRASGPPGPTQTRLFQIVGWRSAGILRSALSLSLCSCFVSSLRSWVSPLVLFVSPALSLSLSSASVSNTLSQGTVILRDAFDTP